jgi:hypothetical protein
MAPTTSFPLTLPSSEFPIKFRMPTGKDQCFSLANQDREKGLIAEYILAVRCIESVNGYEINPDDYVQTFHALALPDINYYFDVFAAMFLGDAEKRETAKDMAKKLLNGESIVGTQKKSPATVAIGKKEDSAN